MRRFFYINILILFTEMVENTGVGTSKINNKNDYFINTIQCRRELKGLKHLVKSCEEKSMYERLHPHDFHYHVHNNCYQFTNNGGMEG